MKKFTNNDLFYNTLLVNPKFTIVMQSGSMRINDQINQNQDLSSSLSGIEYGGTYSYKAYTGSYSYTSSISREFIFKDTTYTGGFDTYVAEYTKYLTVQKVSSLKNIFSSYSIENLYSNINYYLKNNGVPLLAKPAFPTILTGNSFRAAFHIRPSASINLIEIPRDFYGNYIKPGSVQLNMYVSGVLSASAADSDNTGKLYQTYGSGSGSIVGSVFYDHGIILLTGSQQLNNQASSYIQPLSNYASSASSINDYLRWIHFGSYIATTGTAPETKYELIFQGTNAIPTVTMMCHAEKDELYWSNNRTFLEADQGDEIFNGQATSSTDLTGSTYYAASGSILVPSAKTLQENKVVLIKNTISSSFVHYEAPYEPQVFISQIGIYDDKKNLIAIAKVANPVRKTKNLDYTFKLKLDF